MTLRLDEFHTVGCGALGKALYAEVVTQRNRLATHFTRFRLPLLIVALRAPLPHHLHLSAFGTRTTTEVTISLGRRYDNIAVIAHWFHLSDLAVPTIETATFFCLFVTLVTLVVYTSNFLELNLFLINPKMFDLLIPCLPVAITQHTHVHVRGHFYATLIANLFSLGRGKATRGLWFFNHTFFDFLACAALGNTIPGTFGDEFEAGVADVIFSF